MPFQAPTPGAGFRPAATPAQPGGISEDDDELEGERKVFAKHDIAKWRNLGDWLEGVVVDYSDTVPNTDPVSGKVKEYEGRPTYQDVITLLVTAAQTTCTTPAKTEVAVQPGQIVTEWVSGHNKYDPMRPQEIGMSWRVAKDTLGRGLKVGDLVRIDLVLLTNQTWDGKALGMTKIVKAYQAAAPATAEEFQLVEQARQARKALKGGGGTIGTPAPAAHRTVGPSAVPTTPPAAPAAAQAARQAAATTGHAATAITAGLFD